MYYHFIPDGLPSPFTALDHLIISLTYGGAEQEDWINEPYQWFFCPHDAVLHSLGVLGSLYAYILRHPKIKHIYYFLPHTGPSATSADDGITHLLGHTITFQTNQPILSHCTQIAKLGESDRVWMSHMIYLTMRSDIIVTPLLIDPTLDKDTLHALRDEIQSKDDTIAIFCQDLTFFEDGEEHIEIIQDLNNTLIGTFFDYRHNDNTIIQENIFDPGTNLLRSEIIAQEGKKTIYHGVFGLK